MNAGQSHITSIVVARDWHAVFDFMAAEKNLDQWSFGTWRTEISDGLVRGSSLLDGSETFARIDADAKRGAIDYHLGGTADRLVPRICVRVVPGDNLDMENTECVLTIIAWRSANMDDLRWRRLTASHEFEIVLLKSILERQSS